MKMSKNALSTTGLLIGLALFLVIHIFSSVVFQSLRIDLTQNKLFTLTQGSKNILSKLNETITLRYYVSQKLMSNVPGISGYATRVKEMLHEYQRRGGAKLKLLVIDPEPFSDEEDRAVSDGLQGIPINNGTSTFYFGLIGTNSIDEKESIAFFSPERSELLEHDLTKLIYTLSGPKRHVVGLMSSLPIHGSSSAPAMPGQQSSRPWIIVEQLNQLFDVKKLETSTDKIPEDIAVLMLVHPRNLTDKTLYAIDQFVMRGGRVLAFLDPYAEAQQTDPLGGFMANVQTPRHSDLNKLLNAWGVEFISGQVVADRSTALQVQFSQQTRPVLYPVYMSLQPKNYNQDDLITKNLGHMVFASAGILKKKENAEIEFSALIETSKDGMKISASRLGIFSKPEELMRDYIPEGKFTIAARISGKLKSAFSAPPEAKKTEDKDPKDTSKKDEAKNTDHLSETKQPAHIIIVADADFLQDRFWVRVQNLLGTTIATPTAANNILVTNAIENLVGSNDLISVRNRGSSNRPFTKVKELQQKAEQQFLQKANTLKQRLKETETRLKQFESNKTNDNALILSNQQKNEIQRFLNEKVTIRKELRGVQHNLNKEIDNLEAWILFFNIGFIPLLIIIGGIIFAYYQKNHSIKPTTKPNSA